MSRTTSDATQQIRARPRSAASDRTARADSRGHTCHHRPRASAPRLHGTAQTRQAPAVNQYEAGDVVICVYGYAEHNVSQEIADELVAQGVAEYGPCPPTIFNR